MLTTNKPSPRAFVPVRALQPSRLTDIAVVVAVCATAGVTLFVDLALPLGFAGGVPYVLPLVLTFAFRGRGLTWIVALAVSALVIAGWLMSTGGVETWIVVGNRVVALFAVWVTAFGIQLQRSTARALRMEHERKERLLDRSPALFVLLRADGELDFSNQGAEQLTGWRASVLRGERWVTRAVVPDQRAEQEQHLRDVLSGEANERHACQVDLLAVDGRVLHVTMVDSQYELEDGSVGVLRCGVDATARFEAERMLAEQASMARLGEMAALVAHEIKNPLAGIAGGLQIFASRLPEEASELRILQTMQDRIKHLDSSINDLLIFARPQTMTREPVYLADVMAVAVDVIRANPRHAAVRLNVSSSSDPCAVSGDDKLLSAALMNVLGNAAEALEGGGQITVQIDRGVQHHQLSVADDGPGMSAEVLDKIFEPFFTTKLRGTGLGLVITRRTIEAHGGSLTVRSTAGEGTLVQITLPAMR